MVVDGPARFADVLLGKDWDDGKGFEKRGS
jgi:hypothetical protein